MKLYLMPGACSLSPHIVLRELGLDFEPVVVKRDKSTSTGRNFLEVSPNGYVPALELDDGHVLTEGPAIVQYLADQKPDAGLAPANGTWARYDLQSTLNFISTEIHKTFSPLFSPTTTDDARKAQLDKLTLRLGVIAPRLEGKQYLFGDAFTVADAYLFTVLTWSRYVNFDLSAWPSVVAFMERVSARPAVQAALEAEKALRAA
ncbi:MAG: glutathione transferase GstA [Bradymonadia bacterium]